VASGGLDGAAAVAFAVSDGATIAASGKFSADRFADGVGQLSAAVIPATATTSDAATAIAGRVRQSETAARSWRASRSSIGTSGAP